MANEMANEYYLVSAKNPTGRTKKMLLNIKKQKWSLEEESGFSSTLLEGLLMHSLTLLAIIILCDTTYLLRDNLNVCTF